MKKEEEWWEKVEQGEKPKGGLLPWVEEHPVDFLLSVCLVVGILVLIAI